MPKPPARLVHHVRRYPRWYAFAAIWIVGMVALPVITSRAGQIFTADPPATVAADAPLVVPPMVSFVGDPLLPFLALVLADPRVVGEAPLPEAKPPEFIEPTFLDNLFDLIPPPPALPNLPPQLLAVVRAAAPFASLGCTGLGLASLVVAVVAPSLKDVPLERILPYLAPVTSACAYFPIPKVHTVCAFDEPLIIDVGGLTKTPPILGLGIDQLTAIEDVIIEMFGAEIPRLSDTARETLDCKLVTE